MRQIIICAWLASIFLLQISVKSEDQQTPQVQVHQHRGISIDQILIYCGYIILGLGILSLILTCLSRRCKKKQEESIDQLKVAAALDEIKINNNIPSFSSVELKGKTDFSTESNAVSSSLTVLTSPVVNGLKFEDLLRSPAELIGRGRHGSVYKVACEAHGVTLVVKRIKDWTIPGDEFKQRMKRLDRVKHPNVLPVIAFYGSRQEKLLVYEYQKNGNLFKLIRANYGNKASSSSRQSSLDCWSIRLSAAAKIANALAFMHEKLSDDKIPHGNLKSSNILLDENMEPCVSEYGLMMIEENNYKYYSPFKADVYAFGSILLELLTGRMVLDEGLDIASWVLAVVREEWTVEVFDRNLIRQGASEERMVNLLQIAIKCVDKSPDARPSMKDVALGVNAVRDDDERSMDNVASDYSTTRDL